jgi:S-adenosylmethionine-diacylglycerol 3-amino-3-carboxypropyl transferase
MVKAIPKKLAQGTHDLLFKSVHSRWLIYNACWEDPRIDRELLQLNAGSKVVMITSAGCNALDYLLDGPAEIHCVDVNPRQNALLELKLALIRRGDFGDLFAMFGIGSHRAFRRLYQAVRPSLSGYAQRFWDKNICYFDTDNKKRSFYYHGTSGAVAWLLSRYLLNENRGTRRLLMDLLDARSLEEQREIYAHLGPALWGKYISWLVQQPAVLAMLGVPRPQIHLMQRYVPGGVRAYIEHKLCHVLTEILFHSNYFWRVYLTGSYTAECCPNYLKQHNFSTLRANIDRVHAYNTTLTAFLRDHSDAYSHFVLLDHQDWLAWHSPAALEEEWQMLLANSRPGSRVLMRSANVDASFLPATANNALRFFPDLTTLLHTQDRVGTYGSLHFAEVR